MDKITELKSLLAKAWHVAYQLEMEAREAQDSKSRDFFYGLNGEINSLELRLINFVREEAHR